MEEQNNKEIQQNESGSDINKDKQNDNNENNDKNSNDNDTNQQSPQQIEETQIKKEEENQNEKQQEQKDFNNGNFNQHIQNENNLQNSKQDEQQQFKQTEKNNLPEQQENSTNQEIKQDQIKSNPNNNDQNNDQNIVLTNKTKNPADSNDKTEQEQQQNKNIEPNVIKQPLSSENPQQQQKQLQIQLNKQQSTPQPSSAAMQQKKKLGMEQYRILGLLGTGAFGEVLHVQKKSNNSEYAIKSVDKQFLAKEQKQYQMYMERGVLMSLSHVGLVKLNCSFQDAQNLYFVLDHIGGGDFAHYQKLNFKNLVDSTIQFYIAEIILILEYLHSHGVVHRDIKPENIMMTKDRHLKIIDFGTASVFDTTICPKKILDAFKQSQDRKSNNTNQNEYTRERKNTLVGTAEYVSPELLLEEQCGKAADLWAVGIILYKLYNGKTPFYDQTEHLVFERIKEGTFAFPDKMPQNARDLVSQLLKRVPSERIGAGDQNSDNSYKQLKSHPFFDKLNWENIFNQDAPEREIFSPIKSQNKQDLHELSMQYGASMSNQNSPFPQQFQQTPKSSMNNGNQNNISQSAKQSSSNGVQVMTGYIKKKTGAFVISLYNNFQIILFNNPPKLVCIDLDSKNAKTEILLRDGVKIKPVDKNKFQIIEGSKIHQFKDSAPQIAIWITKIQEVKQNYYQNLNSQLQQQQLKHIKKTSEQINEVDEDESNLPPQQLIKSQSEQVFNQKTSSDKKISKQQSPQKNNKKSQLTTPETNSGSKPISPPQQ